MKASAAGVDFRFGQYITEGYRLYTKHFTKVFLAFMAMIVMSVIPFCSYLALGNFMRFLHRLNEGEEPSPSEIFNFDDFLPYIKLTVAVVIAVLVMEAPIIYYAVRGEEMPTYMLIYIFVFIAVAFYLVARAFYMPYLISVKGIRDLRKAWTVSSEMASGNILVIIGFILMVGILAEIGMVACIVGILFTLPFSYTAQFAATEDAVLQRKEIL